ncbi:MAG TPA: hypothetical protein VEN78_08385 [Bradyrhizobium sp.]|nr:hypothetical protein [Bradyrhizobium sp.]
MSSVTTQLEAIHSMLSAGHRSIRMQRHSLVLWGVAGGFLCLASQHIITADRFPVLWLRAVAMLIFLAVVLSGVALADFHYTRYRIRARDESLPFVQTQVTKVWWLLISMGILFDFGTAFFGGGYMVFVVYLVLIGLGIYIHGLFSEEMLEWAGVMMIVLGVAALALPAPYRATQWLAASAFGLGMPLLSAMLDRGESRSVWIRTSQSALWLAVVLVPPLLAYTFWKAEEPPVAAAMSLESFQRQADASATAVVAIPAGTRIPLNVRIGGNIVEDGDDMAFVLTLAKPIEIFLADGRPDGQFREAGGQWKRVPQGIWIRGVEANGTLSPSAGPAASLKLTLTVGD